MKITYGKGLIIPTISSKDIPRGFFTGKIGGCEGLFFRSEYDITLIEGSFGTYWGYSRHASGCGVNNYRSVDVNIEVQP